MHKLIKAELEKNFKILNQNLVNGGDHSKLLLVIDTIKRIIINEDLYINEIGDLFEKHPSLYTPPVQKAVSSIIEVLAGTHPLIDQCFKEDHTKSPLGYCCALTEEIIQNVNFFSVCDNGDIIINDVSNMSFISEVEAMGRLSIIEHHEA